MRMTNLTPPPNPQPTHTHTLHYVAHTPCSSSSGHAYIAAMKLNSTYLVYLIFDGDISLISTCQKMRDAVMIVFQIRRRVRYRRRVVTTPMFMSMVDSGRR